ncbi:hypothetical protein THAOC_31020 [Thalassiosira oceanica]|uniref:Uncharacterized protein n=1 Tax=Thalassiosira oceanica TaxID=159749 RepID=K0RA58_THAOC|nr:hypothetical protein THAOC_31020 [Thalassiosira oceanica]|eukprot:EJK50050.1 hypothetical protein THAOC_31020 [Thalassiosira oceanica]
MGRQPLLPLVGGRQLNPPRRCFYLEHRVRSGARYGGTGEEQRADDSNRRADRAEDYRTEPLQHDGAGGTDGMQRADDSTEEHRAEDYRTEPFGEDGEEGRRRGRRYSTVAAPTTRHIHQMVSRTKTTVADGRYVLHGLVFLLMSTRDFIPWI